MIWCETSEPNLAEAKKFADAIHAKFPGKLLAYNCSPSFNWKKKLDDATIAKFQKELAAMNYKFQFITLAGFHALNFTMFDLARNYKQSAMSAYSVLQEKEFAAEKDGYRAVKHQAFVGTGYFDDVSQVIAGGTQQHHRSDRARPKKSSSNPRASTNPQLVRKRTSARLTRPGFFISRMAQIRRNTFSAFSCGPLCPGLLLRQRADDGQDHLFALIALPH